ncbi:alpha/beta fold hydrolase [Sphingoaurantiacus capsulatus]|uniref:Alpha/beta fold hydrolase n=1 Tax=Sphingoaurantiacus capsulatus TaxID=1771310 RepID=A0ABV7XG47_9SPHN
MTKRFSLFALGRRTRAALAAGAALLLAGAGVTALRAGDGAMPTPGRFVAVGDDALYLDCRGAGSPTIVLEAGATGFAETWAWVQKDLARDHRVCAYDRAGMGRSPGGATAFHPAESADRLDVLLKNAREPGPYLMVGHSLGGALALVYAARHPENTRAVVMVDPPHPDLLSRIPRAAADDYVDFAAKLRLASRLAPLGVMHAVRPFSGPAATLPEEARHAAAIVEVSPDHLRRSYRELAAWPEVETAFRDAMRDNRRPLMVIAAGTPTDGRTPEFLQSMQDMQREIAGGGGFAIVPRADHYSIILDPKSAATVAHAVRVLGVKS